MEWKSYMYRWQINDTIYKTFTPPNKQIFVEISLFCWLTDWLNISSGQTDRVQCSVPIMSSSAQLSHIGLTRGLLFLCHSLTDKQTLSLENCYDFSGYKKTECSSNVLMNNLEIGAKKVLNDNRLWVTHFFNPLNRDHKL